MDQPKIERLLRLMKMQQNNETLTIDEIAARLNVVPRTIYRYIDTLKESGFTVVNIKGDIYSMVEMPQPAPEFDKWKIRDIHSMIRWLHPAVGLGINFRIISCRRLQRPAGMI